MTIKAKLWLSYLFILILLIGSFSFVGKKVSDMRGQIEVIDLLGKISLNYSYIFQKITLRNIIPDPEERDKILKEMAELDAKRKQYLVQVEPLVGRDPKSWQKILTAEKYRKDHQTGVWGIMDQVQRGGYEDSVTLQKDFVKAQELSNNTLELVSEVSSDTNDRILQNLHSTALALVVVFAVVVLLVVGMALYVPGSIIRPINRLVKNTEKIASGDLREAPGKPTPDEVGKLMRSFAVMVASLRALVANIQGASARLSSLSAEMTEGSEETKRGAEQIMTAIEEVTASSEKQNIAVTKSSETLLEFSTLIQGAAREAENALEVSIETRKVAEEGTDVVAMAESKMNEIRRIVENSAEAIKNLGTRGAQITDITRLIAQITEQTDLLALNAAVEAARAGEQGRGFDVVATEVRKLAERSANAALQISDLIEVTQKEISEAIHWMQEGTVSVVEGTGAMRKTGESFALIAEMVNKTVEQINVISQTTRDKIATSDEIIRVIAQVAEASEANVAVVQEVYATTTQQITSLKNMLDSISTVNVLTEELKQEIVKFQV